jgi:translation initiation factor 3 subunit B
MNGTLEFYDVNRKCTMAVNEHFMCNQVAWSPSGVHVVTSVTQPINSREAWRYANENGYKVWTFQGLLKQEAALDQFYQFIWRPRPPTLLSKEVINEVRTKIRETYYKKFDEEDDSIRQSQLSVEARSRADAKKAFRDYRAQCEARVRAEAEERQKLRHNIPSEDEADYEVTEVSVEEETDVQEILLP